MHYSFIHCNSLYTLTYSICKFIPSEEEESLISTKEKDDDSSGSTGIDCKAIMVSILAHCGQTEYRCKLH